MFKTRTYIILFFLLFVDICYSFYQHYQFKLDGDLAINVVPDESCKPVLKDPFGFNAVFYHKNYVGPNRFWAHWSQSKYFKNVPLWLQTFCKPLDSIYISTALAKTIIQILLIWLISLYITGAKNIFNKKFIIAAFLITPLFQTNGYYGQMGIIDPAITYTFFYALPMIYVLLFFWPFYKAWTNDIELQLSIVEKILLVILAIVMLFNGPVVPGIILVFCPMVLLKLFHNKYKLTKSIIKAISNIPKTVLFYFVLVIILALYSIYVGQFNCENSTLVPLLDRYLKIPKGIFELLTFSLGFPVLLIVIITNRILLKKINNFQAERIKTVFRWAIIFIIIYILLLPLGGYRIYRPYIVRRDTIIPVIIALLFMYGYSSYFLLSYLANKKRIFYGAMLIASTIIYTLSDGTKTKNGNSCERQAFKEIAASKDSVVFLQNFDCTVMSWNKITDPAYSECNANLLYLWHITDRKKLYYQK